MKIGIDARFYGPAHAGLGRYTKNLVDQLAFLSPGHEFTIFLHQSNFAQFETVNPRFSKRLVTADHYSVREQMVLPQLLLKEKLDLVHFPHFTLPERGENRPIPWPRWQWHWRRWDRRRQHG